MDCRLQQALTSKNPERLDMSLFERVLVDFVGSVCIVVNFEAVGRIFECVGAGEFIPAKMPWKTAPSG